MAAAVQRRPTPRLDELILRVRGEYREMPGLSLTVPQAQRLWGLDRSTCHTLLERLVEARFVRQTRHGRFVLWDASSPIRHRGETTAEGSADGSTDDPH